MLTDSELQRLAEILSSNMMAYPQQIQETHYSFVIKNLRSSLGQLMYERQKETLRDPMYPYPINTREELQERVKAIQDRLTREEYDPNDFRDLGGIGVEPR